LQLLFIQKQHRTFRYWITTDMYRLAANWASRPIDAKWLNFGLPDSIDRFTVTSKKMRAWILHVSARADTCVPLAQVRLHLITGSSELSRPLKEINCSSNVDASGFDSIHDGSSRTAGGKNLSKEKKKSFAHSGLSIMILYYILLFMR